MIASHFPECYKLTIYFTNITDLNGTISVTQRFENVLGRVYRNLKIVAEILICYVAS